MFHSSLRSGPKSLYLDSSHQTAALETGRWFLADPHTKCNRTFVEDDGVSTTIHLESRNPSPNTDFCKTFNLRVQVEELLGPIYASSTQPNPALCTPHLRVVSAAPFAVCHVLAINQISALDGTIPK